MATPFTQEGYDELSQELEQLKKIERPAIIEAIATARAHGDLKENAEYHTAKDKQGFIEARIKLLEGILSSADILNSAALATDGRCVFGAHVKLVDENEREYAYRLVGEYEANIERGWLSTTSPIGRALIGKYVGEVVTVHAPGGEIEYEIISISYSSS